MQSLLESLLNYILRHHHETLLIGSWNYVLTMRHHHELSPRGSWNYCLTMRHHYKISPKGPWNYILTMRHNHEISPKDSWNYVLNQTKIMSHQSATIYQSRTVSCQYPTNQPTIHVFHFILNIVKSHSHLIAYNIHGIILHAFTVKHSIRQASNHIREPIRTRAWNLPQSYSS